MEAGNGSILDKAPQDIQATSVFKVLAMGVAGVFKVLAICVYDWGWFAFAAENVFR